MTRVIQMPLLSLVMMTAKKWLKARQTNGVMRAMAHLMETLVNTAKVKASAGKRR